MHTKILEEIGLTKTEIKIYLALLKIGQSTTTLIIKESGVPTSKVYEFLERLIQKSLVSYVVKSGKKYFTAMNLDNINKFLEDKKKKIDEQQEKVSKLIPFLEKIKVEGGESIESETYEGLNGLKSIYEKNLSILGKGETHYIIGAPKVGNELLEGYILDWHKRRIKKGINCKYIYDTNVREYGGVRERMKFTSVRYLPDNIISPIWIEIFGEYVMLGHFKEHNAILFLIHDKEIAKGYLDYFNLIWKVSVI